MTGTNLQTLFDDIKFPAIGGKNPFFDVLGGFEDRYPPYNVSKDEGGYLIEIAVPGWSREDLEVTFQDRLLKVQGKKREVGKNVEYMHKSLSTKAFVRTWVISKDLEIESVFLEDGLLLSLIHI